MPRTRIQCGRLDNAPFVCAGMQPAVSVFAIDAFERRAAHDKGPCIPLYVGQFGSQLVDVIYMLLADSEDLCIPVWDYGPPAATTEFECWVPGNGLGGEWSVGGHDGDGVTGHWSLSASPRGETVLIDTLLSSLGNLRYPGGCGSGRSQPDRGGIGDLDTLGLNG
jgi:hypothetical protein